MDELLEFQKENPNIFQEVKVIEKWLELRGFSRINFLDNEFLYLRDSSPDKIATHTLFCIHILKNGDVARIDRLSSEVKDRTRQMALNHLTGGSATKKFFSNISIASYILFLTEHASDDTLHSVEKGKPVSASIYALADVTRKRLAINQRKALYEIYRIDTVTTYQYDGISIMQPIYGDIAEMDPELKQFTEKVRLLPPKKQESIWKEKEYKNKYGRYLSFANQSAFDFMANRGSNHIEKTITAYYVVISALRGLFPLSPSMGADMSNALETAKDMVETGKKQEDWFRPYRTNLTHLIEENKIQEIGYCADCMDTRTGIKHVGLKVICPTSNQHDHISHTMYVSNEEEEGMGIKLKELYTKRRGFFR